MGQAIVVLSGPAAEFRFFQPSRKPGQTLFDYASPGDSEKLAEAAALAEPDEWRRIHWLWEAAVPQTQRLIHERWPEVKKLARAIISKQGVFLAETAPEFQRPRPSPQAAERGRLFKKAMSVLYGPGGIYP